MPSTIKVETSVLSVASASAAGHASGTLLQRARPGLIGVAIVATLGLFAVLIAEIDFSAVLASAAQTPMRLFMLSLGFSAVSYVALWGMMPVG